MSAMFEVFYRAPVDLNKETALTRHVESMGGLLTYREDSDDLALGSVCLTFEFANARQAEVAAQLIRASGEHVEGPVDYGSPDELNLNSRSAEVIKKYVEPLMPEHV